MNLTPAGARLLAKLSDEVLVGFAGIVIRFKEVIASEGGISRIEALLPDEDPAPRRRAVAASEPRRLKPTFASPAPAVDTIPYPEDVVGPKARPAFAKGFKHEMSGGSGDECPYRGANAVSVGCARAWDRGRDVAKAIKAKATAAAGATS